MLSIAGRHSRLRVAEGNNVKNNKLFNISEKFMKLLLKWLIATCAIIVSAYLIPGITVASFWTALWLAFFLSIINIILKPILIILTLPVNILTLGLFTLVINASLILLASSVIKGFEVSGFWVAMLFSIVLSVVSYIINTLLGTKDSA